MIIMHWLERDTVVVDESTNLNEEAVIQETGEKGTRFVKTEKWKKLITRTDTVHEKILADVHVRISVPRKWKPSMALKRTTRKRENNPRRTITIPLYFDVYYLKGDLPIRRMQIQREAKMAMNRDKQIGVSNLARYKIDVKKCERQQ